MEDQSRSRGGGGGGGMEMERYYGQARPPPSHDFFRSYSTTASAAQTRVGNKDSTLKKGKSTSSSSSSNSWSFSDPEFKRKKRVASYKMYSVEGKMKGSLRNSFRWFKDKYSQMVYGWW